MSPVIDKYPLLVLERCSIPSSLSSANSPETQSSDASGFTQSPKRSFINKPKISTPEIESKKGISEKKYLRGNVCYIKKQKHVVESSYKRLPHIITPMKSVDDKSRENDLLITKNPKGSLTPGVPNNGNKFFKHRSPASASKIVGSVIVRKGFDLKFIPRRLSTKFWKESPKKDKNNKKKLAQKVNNYSHSVVKKVNVGKCVADDASSVDSDVQIDFQPVDETVTETTKSDDTGSEVLPDNTLNDRSPTSSISLLSEIPPNVSDSVQSCTGSQDLFSTDDRSEVSDTCASHSSSTSGKKMFPIFDVDSRVSR